MGELHGHHPAASPPVSAADPPIPSLVASTAGLPAAEQFDFWQDRFRPVLEFRRAADAGSGFAASTTAWQLGDFLLGRVMRPAAEAVRTARCVRRAPVDHWALGLARDGTAITETRQGTGIASPGTIFVHSLGEPFVTHGTDVSRLMIYLPRDAFAGAADALDAVCGGTIDSPLAPLLADYLLSLERRLPQIGQSALPALRDATKAMIGACIAPTADRLTAACGPLNGTRKERIRRYIRDHLPDPDLTPAVLARHAGMSRSSLYRLLECEGGAARFVQRQRLLAANSILATPDGRHTIGQVGERVGIPDPATFSRVFRAEFGCTPREARAHAAPGHAHRQPLAGSRETSFWTLLHPRIRTRI